MIKYDHFEFESGTYHTHFSDYFDNEVTTVILHFLIKPTPLAVEEGVYDDFSFSN